MEKNSFDHPNFSGLPTAPPTFEEATSSTETKYPPHCTAPSIPAQPHGITINVPRQQVCTVGVALGPCSATIHCPHCRREVLTTVEKKVNVTAHICCFLLFLCVCTLPCSCLPYCMDSFQSHRHTCPRCGNFFGEYKS